MTVDLCAEARAEHLVGASRSGEAFVGDTFFAESLLRYIAKWHGPAWAAVFAAAGRLSWGYAGWSGRIDAARSEALVDVLRRRRD